MTSHRFFAALLLLAAFLLYGCGSSSSSKSTQPMDITSGTWTIAITQNNNEGPSWTLTATFKTFPCSNTNITLGPDWTIPGPLTATVCMTASSLNTTTSGAPTPQGLIIGLGANPVPANGTTTMPANTSYMAVNGNSGSEALDLTATFTASSKSVSGTYVCDTSSAGTCGTDSGTFTGTMK